MTRYQVIDAQTRKVIRTTTSRNGAYRTADRKDREYGAVRYIVRPLWDDMPAPAAVSTVQ